jgi:hypothetical protein
VADGGGLENRCEGNLTVGSNPTPSALTSENTAKSGFRIGRKMSGGPENGRRMDARGRDHVVAFLVPGRLVSNETTVSAAPTCI